MRSLASALAVLLLVAPTAPGVRAPVAAQASVRTTATAAFVGSAPNADRLASARSTARGGR